MSAGTKRYPQELKARAVQIVIDARVGQETEWATISRVADLLGIGSPETVRKWLRQAEIDTSLTGTARIWFFVEGRKRSTWSRCTPVIRTKRPVTRIGTGS